jgi:hypothetical protein
MHTGLLMVMMMMHCGSPTREPDFCSSGGKPGLGILPTHPAMNSLTASSKIGMHSMLLVQACTARSQ